MARRKIDVTIGAKDNASAVFKRVGASTIALGAALGNLASKMVSGAFNWLKAGVADALENEQANFRLAQAMKTAGDASGAFAKDLGDQINALQGVTGASNTYLTQMATQLSVLGVHNDQLGSTLRLLHALEGANIKGETAIRGVTRALQGDFSALSRYIPALRTANTEVEKWTIINQTAERGLQTQIDNLSTLSGAWAALKTHLGSVKDDIWEVISRGLGLGDMFGNLADAIDTFRNSKGFKSFLDGIERASALVRGMVTALTSGEIKLGESFKFLGEYLLAIFKDGANHIGEAISTAIGKQWWANSSNTQKMEKLQAKLLAAQERVQLEARHAPVAAGPVAVHRMGSALVDSRQEVARLQAAIAELERKMTAGGSNVASVLAKYDDLVTAVKKAAETSVAPTISRVHKADEALGKLRQDAEKRIATAVQRAAAAEDQRAKLADMAAAGALALKRVDEEIREAKGAVAKAAERERKASEEVAKAQERKADVLKMTVADLLAEVRQDAQAAKDAQKHQKDMQRAGKAVARAREQLARGERITPHQRRLIAAEDKRIDAFRDVEAAQKAEQAAFDEHAAEQARLDEAQRARDVIQEEIRDTLDDIRGDLQHALTAQ